MENKTSFFTTYDQKENRVTNYCLLMLNQVYSYSPLLFNQILSNLTDELNFGVNFYQQQGINTKKGKQIADGIISQEPITIYVETKNFDWFYNNQIEGYLDNLTKKNGKKLLLLLSNFDNSMDKINSRINEIEKEYENDNIHIYPVNFIELYQEILHISNNIQNDMFICMLNDFETFLLHENLLPIWKYIDLFPKLKKKALEKHRKCIFITGDVNISKRKPELQAFKNNDLVAFILPPSYDNYPLWTRSVYILHLWQALTVIANKAKVKTIYKLPPHSRELTTKAILNYQRHSEY